MEPLEYLLEFLVKQVGIEATFQVVYEAVNQNTASLQSQELYSALQYCIKRQQQQDIARVMLWQETQKDWSL